MITEELEFASFEQALFCINDSDLHPLLRSAYLDFVISAFVDYNVEESGTDIDNIWRSFVSDFYIAIENCNTGKTIYSFGKKLLLIQWKQLEWETHLK